MKPYDCLSALIYQQDPLIVLRNPAYCYGACFRELDDSTFDSPITVL